MELQVGVKALLRNKDNKYLILTKSKEKYPEFVESWDIPGGRIDPGYTLLENLKREVLEETSLEIEDEPQLIYAQDILNIPRYPDRHVVRLTYVTSVSGEPKLDSDEHDKYKWVSLEMLMSMDGVDRFLKEALKNTKADL